MESEKDIKPHVKIEEIPDEIYKQLQQKSVPLLSRLEALFVFLIIFVIIIPSLLFKFDYNFVLLYYVANLDLLANVLNHWYIFFDSLYFPDPFTRYSIFSSSFINFISLLGLSAIISNITLVNKSVYYGVASATTLILITHLVPTTFIYTMMKKIDNYLNAFYNKKLSNSLSVLIGFIVSVCFVTSEIVISDNYIASIANLYKMFYNNVKNLI